MRTKRRKDLACDNHLEDTCDLQCNGECGGRCNCKYAGTCEDDGCKYQTHEASSTQAKKTGKTE